MHNSALVFLLLWTSNRPVAEKPAVPRDKQNVAVVFGYIHHNDVFAARKTTDDQDQDPAFNVYRRGVSVRGGVERAGKRYEYLGVGWTPPMFRWRVSDGCYWGIGDGVLGVDGASVKRIALDELGFFDPANLTGEKEYRKRHRNPDWSLDPIRVVAVDYQRRKFKREFEIGFVPDRNLILDTIHFDLLPLATDTALLFVLDGDTMRVWRGAASKAPEEKRQEWDLKWTEVKEDKHTTEMREPFIVYAKGADYYFVSQSGKVYVSRKPTPKVERKAEAFWTDAKSPVHAVISDVDSGSIYAFTGGAKEGDKEAKQVYFELGDKEGAKPYALKSLDDAKLDKPLKIVLEYTQVLLDDGKIKAPKEGDPKK